MSDTSALDKLSVRELKTLLQTNGIDSSTCFEKSELLDLAKRHNLNPNSTPKPQPQQTQSSNSSSSQQNAPPQKASPYAHMSYYEILDIEKTADKSTIKKAYYLKARKCHPDKNPDDPHAEELFKAVSEAYNVLTDDEKRKTYDKFGKAGLASDGAGPDPATLFKMMFGGGFFENEFGELSMLGKIIGANTEEATQGTPPDSLIDDLKDDSDKKRKKLEIKLLIKIEPYLQGNADDFKKIIETEIADKAEAPGGSELLKIVGNIYIEKGKQYQGRFLGLEGLFSSIGEKVSLVGQVVDAFGLTMKMYSEMQKLQAMQENSQTIDEATQSKLMSMGLNVFWTMGKLEIDRTVHAVCEAILTEAGIPERLIKSRAAAIRLLGEMYVDAGFKASKNTSSDKPFDLPDHIINPKEKEKEKRKSTD